MAFDCPVSDSDLSLISRRCWTHTSMTTPASPATIMETTPHDAKEDMEALPPSAPTPDTLTTQDLQALFTVLQDLKTENREMQQKMRALQTQGTADQRQRVISNSRASVHLLPSTPLAPPPRVGNTSFLRRLTMAEKLQTPRTPGRVHRAIDVPDVDEVRPIPVSIQPDDEVTRPHETQTDMPQKTPSWSTNEKGLALLVKKLEPPPTYTGDTQKDKISDLRQWVARADDYMDIHMGEGVEGGRLQVVIQWTGGAAKDYLKQKKKELDLLYEQGQLTYPAEWVEIKHDFIDAFEGDQYRMLQRVELEALRLGLSKCKTPMMLNAEFERLASRLWPSGTDLAAFDHVLGDEYGKIIERSDINLWRDIYRGGIPHTLSDWKARTAAAWGARQIVSQRVASGRSTFGRGYGRSAEQPPLPVNELQAAEEVLDGVAENDQESGRAEPPSSVNLQQASIGTRTPRTGVQLTEDIRKQLMAKGMCFSCYKRGHRARDINECPNKGKRAARLPTKEELNA